MGLIWLKHPVLWHSSRMPSGYDYSKMTPEQVQLLRARWHNWYTADLDYCHTIVGFLCAGIGTMVILHLISLYRGRANMRRASLTPQFAGAVDRFTAAFRYVTSAQFRFKPLGYYSPPLGSVLGVGSIFIFVMSLLLAVRPYYWPNDAMGHSPPLATRSGWISVAIMPFMIAFATKINFVGILTGSSHEKLQVYHRWTALFMYITSLTHTFPFIVNNIRMGTMTASYKTSSFYWTGIAALVPQTYLIFLSWGIIRNRYYEMFKKIHFIASGIFMAALFIHCNFRLTSWDYFWATLAIYGSSWLLQVLRTLFISAFGLRSSIHQLSDPDMVKVTIEAPLRFKWKPGQHVFLRFLTAPGLHPLSTHPFTISNIPSEGMAGKQEVEVVFRVHGGITKALQKMAMDKATSRVFLDGPYGGLPVSLRGYDRVYLLSGGSGASFTLPLLMDLAKGLRGGIKCSHINFILAVRHLDSRSWMDSELALATKLAEEAGATLAVDFYVTGEDVAGTQPEAGSDKNADGKSVSESMREAKSIDSVKKTEGIEFATHAGRPNLPEIITKACASELGGRLAVAACGPQSFIYDIRNAVAQCELDIADGYGRCQEVYLHTEAYDW
ncbi:hypothetical protein DENSPDRAFT_833976 [Dentipellis sp. KUC8613]|nr:hypothetical protein DENSPDRAFT_833976 [Dentipellis sp. KUC8613]